MSYYLCFPNNVKDLRYDMSPYMISCNIFFKLMVTEYMFEDLLEISDTFSIRLNVFKWQQRDSNPQPLSS